MMRIVLSLGFLLSSTQVFAQQADADEYCKKLDEERGGFLDLVPPAENKKLTPVVQRGLEKKMTLNQVLAEAKKRRLHMNEAQIAAYKRDFYNANCKTLVDGAKISENLPPDQSYCRTLAKIADEADRYMTNPKNITNNWSEMQAINTAVYRDMSTEALEKMLSFEEYAKIVAAKYKALGKEISLGQFARAQYTQMFYQKYCILEAEAVQRPKAAADAKTTDLRLPEFKPIESADASPAKTSK